MIASVAVAGTARGARQDSAGAGGLRRPASAWRGSLRRRGLARRGRSCDPRRPESQGYRYTVNAQRISPDRTQALNSGSLQQ